MTFTPLSACAPESKSLCRARAPPEVAAPALPQVVLPPNRPDLSMGLGAYPWMITTPGGLGGVSCCVSDTRSGTLVRTRRHLDTHAKVSLKDCLRALGEELYTKWSGEGSTVKRLVSFSTGSWLQRAMGSHAESLDALFAVSSLNEREYVIERGKSQSPNLERPNNAFLLEFWKALYQRNKQWNGPQKFLSFAIGGHHKASETVQAFLIGSAGSAVAPTTLNENEARVASDFSFRVAYHYRAGPCTLGLRSLHNWTCITSRLKVSHLPIKVFGCLVCRLNPFWLFWLF
jgi:hypothetical protein